MTKLSPIEKATKQLETGEFEAALKTLAPVLRSNPNDPMALLRAATANTRLGNNQIANRQLHDFLHKSPDWRGKRILFLKALHENGDKANICDLGFHKDQIDHKPVFISSSPRSGVNLLSGSIHHYSGLPFKYSYQEGDDDQQLNTADLVQATSEKCIVSQHTRCNHRVLGTLQALEIKPIILVNDIFVALVSYVHHIDTHKSPRTLAGAWFELNFTEKLDHVIELQAFWNIDFFVSWTRARKAGLIDYDLLTFFDLTSKLAPTLFKIANENDFLNNQKDISDSLNFTFKNADWLISKEIEEAKTYDPEHARSFFTKEQRARVEKIGSLVQDIDLTPIGL